MVKKLTAAVLTAVILLQLTACVGRNKNNDNTSSADDVTSFTETDESEEFTETLDYALTFETLDTPDFSQREKYISPFEFPYSPENIKQELIAYGESQGLIYNSELSLQDAKTADKTETKSAVNGRVLETWCEQEINNITELAKRNYIPIESVEFNIQIIESASYDGEYDITLFSK